MNYDDFFFATPHEKSTQHTARTRQRGLQYTDLALNEARIMRCAVVHTMLQASVQLPLCYVQQLKTQNVHFSCDILGSTYGRCTYMHIIRTCTIGRSTYTYSVLLCGTTCLVYTPVPHYTSTSYVHATTSRQQQQQLAAAG